VADQISAGQNRKPWWSKAILIVATLGIASIALLHLTMTFLVNSPPNTVTAKFSVDINKWIYPWFDQNWRLFAPNPLSENVTVEARVSADCGKNVTPWYNLTAMDDAAVSHNPFPGHTEQNELRRAWLDGYLPTHGTSDDPIGIRGEMMRQYLVDIALERIRPLTAKDGLAPAAIADIQFRVTTQAIAPAATPKQPPAPEVRTVPWRQVSPDIVSYGCPNGNTPT
jgi:hypothetical protein